MINQGHRLLTLIILALLCTLDHPRQCDGSAGDMMRRFHQIGIWPLIWSIDCGQPASLVIVSAETACTQRFLEYCRTQVSKQSLARLMIDEGHLTITASDFWQCVAQLGWYVRQVRRRSGTLPPVMQKQFIEHNKLAKPRTILKSTNRPNIKYMVSFKTGPGTFVKRSC